MINETLEFDKDGILYWTSPSLNKYALPKEYCNSSLIEILQKLTKENHIVTRNLILKELEIF